MNLRLVGQHNPIATNLVVLSEDSEFRAQLQDWSLEQEGEQSSIFNVYLLDSHFPSNNRVTAFANSLREHCKTKHLKRITVLGHGVGASIAMAFTCAAERLVRRLVVLDACTRIAPSYLTRLIDRLESRLPIGLPLRTISDSYDARPQLHRIHCPTLILTSTSADNFTLEQSKLIELRTPNSWRTQLQQELHNGNRELVEAVSDFVKIPVKRPQKAM